LPKKLLERGIAINSIVELAASEKIDYIVMGTTGAGGLKEVLMGSLTEKVINQATVPVLCIPAQCYYKPLKHFLFICHYEKARLEILKNLIPLAKRFNAQLDVLQVQAHHEPNDHDVIAEWKAAYPNSGIAFHQLTSQDYEGCVMDFIKLNKENIVIIPRHHKSFLDKLFSFSLSRKLAFHSTIPLLTIPV